MGKKTIMNAKKKMARPVIKPKLRIGEKLVWDSQTNGTYVKKKHGELK